MIITGVKRIDKLLTEDEKKGIKNNILFKVFGLKSKDKRDARYGNNRTIYSSNESPSQVMDKHPDLIKNGFKNYKIKGDRIAVRLYENPDIKEYNTNKYLDCSESTIFICGADERVLIENIMNMNADFILDTVGTPIKFYDEAIKITESKDTIQGMAIAKQIEEQNKNSGSKYKYLELDGNGGSVNIEQAIQLKTLTIKNCVGEIRIPNVRAENLVIEDSRVSNLELSKFINYITTRRGVLETESLILPKAMLDINETEIKTKHLEARRITLANCGKIQDNAEIIATGSTLYIYGSTFNNAILKFGTTIHLSEIKGNINLLERLHLDNTAYKTMIHGEEVYIKKLITQSDDFDFKVKDLTIDEINNVKKKKVKDWYFWCPTLNIKKPTGCHAKIKIGHIDNLSLIRGIAEKLEVNVDNTEGYYREFNQDSAVYDDAYKKNMMEEFSELNTYKGVSKEPFTCFDKENVKVFKKGKKIELGNLIIKKKKR